MSNAGAASLAALIPARAAASRRNGAKSRGPKTAEGKARSATNALKHGLCAEKSVVLGDEDQDLFDALEAALTAVLAPQDALEAVLARRIVLATWRLERVDRMEGELLAQNMPDTASFGLGLIRDCKRGRAFDTLLRYRGTALAEFFRALRTLKALQAEAAAHEETAAAPRVAAPAESGAEIRIKPKTPGIPEESAHASGPTPTPAPAPAPVSAAADTAPQQPPCGRVALQRIEPEPRTNPGESVPSMAYGIVRGVAALLTRRDRAAGGLGPARQAGRRDCAADTP